MNSRERVLKIMEGGTADQIPFDLGSTRVTGITKEAYENYMNYLAKDIGPVHLYDFTQQLVEMPEDILSDLGVDIRGLSPNVTRVNPEIEEKEDAFYFKDEWGMKWRMPKRAGLYFDVYESPLAGELTFDKIKNYAWPDPTREELFDGIEEKAKTYYEQGYAIILESFGAGVFEMACRLRGYEAFYKDLVRNLDLASVLMKEIVRLKLEFYEKASDKLGKYIQFIREGDDIGGQDELLISPKAYKNYLKPLHTELFSAQKDLFPEPFYVFLHSDGAIYDILPDFIESGVEVLNPLQIGAKGMNLRRINEEFGDKLVFWGGAIDTQETLPHGAPEDVAAEVEERAKDLAPGGGYIFGAVHNIQGDVPPENLEAFFNAFSTMKIYWNN